ncbi:hypothetical protein CEP54_011620 [Fusarium duplospermum]|uniref:Uncharacterized protein n=1 Tax=Fusarium duplospermum TaxID=1325734 RepID=A0A428PDG7_9HYPO|nr:hypothetical protein CEP54_011620 [Fusarium duplospermum]
MAYRNYHSTPMNEEEAARAAIVGLFLITFFATFSAILVLRIVDGLHGSLIRIVDGLPGLLIRFMDFVGDLQDVLMETIARVNEELRRDAEEHHE